MKLLQVLPADIQGTFQGTAQAFQNSFTGMGLLLVAAILVIYIILGILYESFIHPHHDSVRVCLLPASGRC